MAVCDMVYCSAWHIEVGSWFVQLGCILVIIILFYGGREAVMAPFISLIQSM